MGIYSIFKSYLRLALVKVLAMCNFPLETFIGSNIDSHAWLDFFTPEDFSEAHQTFQFVWFCWLFSQTYTYLLACEGLKVHSEYVTSS